MAERAETGRIAMDLLIPMEAKPRMSRSDALQPALRPALRPAPIPPVPGHMNSA